MKVGIARRAAVAFTVISHSNAATGARSTLCPLPRARLQTVCTLAKPRASREQRRHSVRTVSHYKRAGQIESSDNNTPPRKKQSKRSWASIRFPSSDDLKKFRPKTKGICVTSGKNCCCCHFDIKFIQPARSEQQFIKPVSKPQK
jgi:hypothetical protein